MCTLDERCIGDILKLGWQGISVVSFNCFIVGSLNPAGWISRIMDKLYLDQENERDVDDLLAQINDENILKMSVNIHHKGANRMRTPFLEDQELGNQGINAELEARYASLKAPRPKAKERGTISRKSKQIDILKTDVSASSKRCSKAASKGEQSVSQSKAAVSDEGDSLNAELIARFQALKGPSVPQELSDGEASLKSGSSGSNTPILSEHLKALKTRSKKSPQMSPSRPDYPPGVTVSSTSVGSSGWCAPASPFKMMRVLSTKKSGPDSLGPVSRSSSHSSQTRDAKKAIKRSLSHTSKDDDQEDPSAVVADVQRLLAAVSKEGRSEREQCTAKEALLVENKRAFNMKDRDTELLKAMEDEEAIALEAEKVVEWAKDNARLEGSDEEFEDELDIEVTDSDDSDDSAGAKLMNTKKKTSLLEDADPEESKKRKGRRRWNFL